MFLCCSLGLATLSAASGFAQNSTPQSQPAAPADAPYRNPKLTVNERVADLLPRLTLEEKVDQISGGYDQVTGVIDPTGTYDLQKALAALAQEGNPDYSITPRNSALLRNAIQRYQLEKTRLGIPALFMGESLHGDMEDGSTSFPQALGLAATWDPALVHQVFTAAGNEAGARGQDQVFAPVLGLAREPRWGRTEELYGEDPWLVSRMGVAAVTGLQGPDYLIGRDHVMATAKHYAVHSQPEGGTNTAPGNYSERIIRENFFVPFQAVVQEANVGSIMASYNEIDGIPSHINHWLLDRVLRQEWGFQGFITSDGDGIQMLWQTHHVAVDNADAARQALSAGIDYDLSDGSAYHTLLWQVKQGVVPESDLDRAVSKVLAAKFRLGLFDNPYVDPDATASIVNSPAHRALAEKAAEEVVVLLKNDKNLLPLDLAKLHSIAVIGPNAADVHLGGYSRQPGHEVSILQGIRDYVGSKATINYAEGGKITTAPEGWRGWYANDVQLAPEDPAAIAQAVAAARKSDVAILVVGENESTNREAWSENHLGDRDSLDLVGGQEDLVKAVVATGKPVVVLLINGRPLSINYIAQNVPAILEGFYLGEEGGTAAARVLFGDVDPGGKLPITFPHSVGDLPDFYNHKPSDNRTYAFSTRQPLYPFGFGLSYTTFKFDNLRVEPKHIETAGTAQVSVDVTNTGTRAGDEVPQLYVHQEVASVTRPVMQLRGFQRITLAPGEKRTVSFTIGPDDLSLLNADMHKVVEPGTFDIMVGPSSADTSTIHLEVGNPGVAPKAPLPPPPAGSESGVVSTFDDGDKPTASYGSWMPASDSMQGGKSNSAIAIVSPGADNSKGALQVTGEVMTGSQYPFAGVMFTPGSHPMEPTNLSAKKEIRFWAKGDGHSYTFLVLTAKRSGQNGMPAMVTFTAGPQWKQYTFPFSAFETDGSDLSALAFAAVQNPGKFSFEIDQVEIR
ncbi:MAG TPA: CIA30 family protein [Acidobacteriaceae bacterium]|nr:CIA30 family protein [Acidobacteriaceae bacterium]